MTDTKEKKTRTPKNIDSIRKGALNLPLNERVLLRDNLTSSIEDEVAIKRQEYEDAEKIAGGNK